MPGSYGNHTKSKHCVVTFSGQGNGIIIFNHQRLNAANGPCLRQNTIGNEIHDGPCLEQRVYFRRETEITLIIGEPVQPGFVIYFKGTPPSMLWNCLSFSSIGLNTTLLVATRTLSRPWPQMRTDQNISHYAFEDANTHPFIFYLEIGLSCNLCHTWLQIICKSFKFFNINFSLSGIPAEHGWICHR